MKINQPDEVKTLGGWNVSMPEITFDYSLSILHTIFGSNFEDNSDQMRKRAFDEYLEDAKDYKVQIESKIAELNKISSKINYLETILDEEEQLLKSLDSSISMKRDSQYRVICDVVGLTFLESHFCTELVVVGDGVCSITEGSSFSCVCQTFQSNECALVS